ncbi:cytochrome P450 [Nocardia transvalensis]|uniref:Cytochrome P450 n=1 Tax=Nocardia transvalensis TaxID=37333 RepID=A0A7W9PJG0_9NOCA|nr:cytochrome P450 [Nocardia transvalensis]MBB5917151.1 cytochrome P450 [Nocardia transvalensis]
MVSVDPRAARAERENIGFFEIPDRHPIDRLLRRLPAREQTLATPPSGSGHRAVRGDSGLPYLGRSLQYLRWGPAEMLDRYHRYGPVGYYRSLGVDRVLVAGPEAVDEVVGKRRNDFGQGWDYLIGSFFRRGLLLLEFSEHMFHRRIMQQAFTRDRLEAHLAELAPVVDGVIDRWARTGSRRVRLYPTVKDMTLDIAAETFMGARTGPERERLGQAFVDSTHAPLALVRAPLPGSAWRAGLRGRKVLEEYFTRKLPDKRRDGGADFFSALCHARTEDGETFSDADVVNHMIFLIMAAHDTTTTTATTVAYYLGRHPDWQERVRAEALALRDRLGGRAPTIADLEELRDLDLVIKESLRLVPPVPGLVRRAVRDTEIAGHYIPAGTQVDVAYGVNHLLPELWSHPARFDPERFGPDRREDKSHRLAWMPFGAGAHKCIGMHFGVLEVKVILAAMVRDYEWRIPDDYLMPWGFTTIPFPRDGAPMLLRRR